VIQACLFTLTLCAGQTAEQGSAPAAEVDSQVDGLSDLDLIQAVDQATDEGLGATLRPAFDRFIERVDDFRLEQAEALIAVMHRRSQASWSAQSLATLLGRADRFDDAFAALDDQLTRTPYGPERKELIKARALLTLGAGDVTRSKRELGAALIEGSSDAGVVLGFLAISEGQLDRARTLSRALLKLDPAPAWARRSWGLSMLPPSANSL